MDENNNLSREEDNDDDMKVEINDCENDIEPNSFICEHCPLVLNTKKALDHRRLPDKV